MDAGAVAEELAQQGAQELLQEQLLRLAYAGLDGLPRVVPAGFLWTRGRIVVCTATTAPKVKALAARPGVAITIDRGDTPGGARSLLLRGIAELDVVDGVADEYLQAAAKAMQGDELAGFEAAVRQMYPQMVRISIMPTWARFFDFGTGRWPVFMQELAATMQERAAD
jgi:nitroimidazol reductase NimA-like FMN-containing flavoprotein (pyridoxamine 5'-phosphate oxidase superfamily)